MAISILHLEDNPVEAEYYGEVLSRGGLDCAITLAKSKEEFILGLEDPAHAIILSDYTIPGFSGKAALELARDRRPELPFIFLSGSIGEEAAVAALKNGATDYILKDRANRLVAAVLRALEEKKQAEIRKQAEAALRLSEERYALAASGANDGLWDWDLKENALYFSPRWKTMLGHLEADIGDSPDEWLGRIHPEDADVVRMKIDLHLKGATPKLECEYRMRTMQGSYIWVLCRGLALRDGNGKPHRMAGSQGDITERKRAVDQLQYDAFHDGVTGLFNRNLLLNTLQRLLWMGRRKGGIRFTVVVFGLDRFGAINHSLGRLAGDQILKETAVRIGRGIRPGDTLARLGGDEFAVLLEDVESQGDAVRMARNVQGGFKDAFVFEGGEAFMTLSAGVVHVTEGHSAAEEVLRDAGIALAKAKAQGKSSFCVFDTGMHARAVSLLTLETDLRRAVERDEFRLHYQPIVDLSGGKLAGFEALVRWQHPARGLVPPIEFIPVAEETHLINDIGRIVLEKACVRMRQWQKDHPHGLGKTVSVNVSGRQFRQPDLIREIKGILSDTGLSPGSLKLEVTETAIMDNPQAAAEMLSELRSAGISLQIDDFGTGYSSLGYLHKFPMQALKIDRSFVNLIGERGEDSEIASTIVAMAHNLKMQVIAEGIETGFQLRHLKEMRCDFGQGYFFHRPLAEDAAEKLVASGA